MNTLMKFVEALLAALFEATPWLIGLVFMGAMTLCYESLPVHVCIIGAVGTAASAFFAVHSIIQSMKGEQL